MVKRSTVTRSLGVATVATVMLLPATSATSAPATAQLGVVRASQPPGTAGSFTNVSAVPHSTDVWAFGVDQTKGNTNLVARRHNGAWQREKVDFGKGTVSAIAAASPKVVWAAGVHGANRPWIGRWNGKTFKSAKLARVTSGSFYSMSASSKKNAWAVGHVADPHNGTGFAAEHWNGKKWTPVGVPNLIMTSVSTTSATNAWATAGAGVLMHWHGKGWLEYTPAPSNVILTSVVAISARKAVAVGYITNRSTGVANTYITRFNGTRWSRVPSANPYHGNQLSAVTAHGSSLWAVGYGVNRVGTSRTLIEHSSGGKWKVQKSPIGGYSSLNGVSAASAKRVYTVGSYRPSTDVDPVTCFAAYNGHSWTAESAKV